MSLNGAAQGRLDAAAAHQEIEQVEISAKYHGYIERQRDEVEQALSSEQLRLPAKFDYGRVRGLSNEVKQKLTQQQPETLGQASRIQGVTPAAISLLLVHLKRHKLGAESLPS
jgi:tRNA uridine 5-carboxymethylaminomethyl modification enzyme